jgi:predicted AAA+ superfamily ATPase
MSYVIYLHPAYNANINKQLVKAPKLFFYDVGLASLLLDIRDMEQVRNHSMRGPLFENMIVIEVLKSFYNRGLRPSLYYYRDKRKEVDLVYKEASH